MKKDKTEPFVMPSYVYDVREVTTFRQLIEGSAARFAERVAVLWREGDETVEKTYETLYREMVALATALRRRVPEGSRVAVVGKNSYYWGLSYLAVTCGVGIVVPIDKDLRGDEIAALLNDAEASAVLYSSEIAEKLENEAGDWLKIDMASIPEMIAEGETLLASGDRAYAEHHVDPNALGILLYTSGTTGVAKGVMLSQYNVCFDLTHVIRRLKITEEDRALSIAPLHHTFECTAGFLTMLYCGCSIAYNSSLKRLPAELKLFQPTVMAVVPLVLETFRRTIIKKYNQMKGGRLVLSVQRLASDLTGARAGRRIFSLINETFGGKMRLFVCGAAPLSPDVYRDYTRFGIRVCIGYGLTETSPVSIMHNDFYSGADDIGFPLSGVQAKLEDVNEDGVGELLVKGPNVMLGYYRNPEETARVMQDGWFRTGDLARITATGAFQITGRAKSMIVTSGGKKVFPEELELFLDRSPYVKESLVCETDQNGSVRLTAILVPDEESVAEKLKKQGAVPGDDAYSEKERALFEDLVASVNTGFPHYKHITRIVLRREEFEKTTTHKILRNAPGNTAIPQ